MGLEDGRRCIRNLWEGLTLLEYFSRAFPDRHQFEGNLGSIVHPRSHPRTPATADSETSPWEFEARRSKEASTAKDQLGSGGVAAGKSPSSPLSCMQIGLVAVFGISLGSEARGADAHGAPRERRLTKSGGVSRRHPNSLCHKSFSLSNLQDSSVYSIVVSSCDVGSSWYFLYLCAKYGAQGCILKGKLFTNSDLVSHRCPNSLCCEPLRSS